MVYDIKNIKQPKLIRDLRNFGGYSVHHASQKTMYAFSSLYHTLNVLNTDQLIYGTPFKSLYYPQVDRTIKNVHLDRIKVVSNDGKWLYGLGDTQSSPTQRFRIIDISTDTAKTVYEKGFEHSTEEFALSKDYKTAYLIEPYGGGLKIVDISSHDSHARLMSEIKFDDGNSYDIVETINLSPDNLKAYVSYIGGLYIVDLSVEQPKVIEHITLEKGDYFKKLIISKDGIQVMC